MDPKVGKQIDWTKFLNRIDNHKINNWPTEEAYKPQFNKNGTINLKAYKKDQLITLIKLVENRTITFTK